MIISEEAIEVGLPWQHLYAAFDVQGEISFTSLFLIVGIPQCLTQEHWTCLVIVAVLR